MSSIIEQIYMLQLDEEQEKIDLNKDEEYITYEKLRETLSDEQKKEFDKFVELYGDRLAFKQEKMYRKGFQTAFKLLRELE